MDTNKLTKEINDILHPRVALIAYASREGESFFVEAREIDGKGKMGEGVPVTVEFMNELVRGIPNIAAIPLTGESPPICYGATHAKAVRSTSGTIHHGKG